MDIRGVIFDIDGTLIDSNDAHTRAWLVAFSEEGMQLPYAEVRKAIGMGGDKLLPVLTGIDAKSPQGKRLSKRRGEIFSKRYLHNLQSFPGATELVERLQAGGFKLAIASSAKEAELHSLLKLASVEHLIPRKTSSDDVERSKPDPDAVQVALQKLGLPPEQVVMIGDTPYDMEAARKAGVHGLALRCGGWNDEALVQAEWIYDSPVALLVEYSSTPFAHFASAA